MMMMIKCPSVVVIVLLCFFCSVTAAFTTTSAIITGGLLPQQKKQQRHYVAAATPTTTTTMKSKNTVLKMAEQKDKYNDDENSTTNLQDFRTLMGSLYGVAGVAHLVDLTVGDSALLTAAGAPVFTDLSVPGQAYALLWCLSGPMAFVASRAAAATAADFGLVLYGVIEVSGAVLLKVNGYPSDLAVINAVVVQVVVAASWIYSSSSQDEK